ncbi:hypothetical protein GAYE_SCF61G6515 [Galdieria yellowstonensis]|uniref:Mediator of RNA polymerase II transcription subunit 9 n=1 Tax=Galdieria yellowstonensis TaxID=3028027 RepID=A0AAV9IMB7_9RHOD|nr:hypothetical protein GAYE_SCF61G6515 [Galdieria yellowstonensis]
MGDEKHLHSFPPVYQHLAKLLETIASRREVNEVMDVWRDFGHNMQLLETTIETWPGADYTREEQLEKIQQLQQSVERKRDQLRQLVQAIQQLETK